MTIRSRTRAARTVPERPWSASAREGRPDEAWKDLPEGLSGAPVLGPSGHGLSCEPPTGAAAPATAVVGVLAAAGCSWTLLARLDHPERAAAPPQGWLVGVAAIRLGLSLWLRDQAVARLRGRKVGGTALVYQQLVRDDLARAATEQAMAESLLTGPTEHSDALATVRASRHITAADRRVLRLFGASGFLSDGPGQVAYLSELMADAYLEPVPADTKGDTR
ncbi:acyl-CoA dehydrogenase family protein [Nocardiopsis sp. YSL2]|uniref:acyl-CoA dehydrogenase family protein n=1 Tax=Nocardiopsis sp. YSL2 TaxID=2939492 RepID=UPI0026F44D70|nr:acyl-CoA dehydrogenase family protein [Nocardiopsis sp. YSL2]